MAQDMRFSGATGRSWARLSACVDDDRGVPRQKFEKEIITVGEHYKESEDQTFEVTAELLEHWAETDAAMRENGVGVWISDGHADEDEVNTDPFHSDHTRGRVEELFVRDDALVMRCEMIGKDGIAAAARNDVSINSPISYTDSTGVKHDQPIRNVVLCPDPVVAGLGDWVAIAASSKRRNGMANWKKLATALGIEEEVTDDNAAGLIGKAVSGKLKLLKGFESKAKKLSAEAEADDDEGNEADPAPAPKKKAKKEKISPAILSSISRGRKAQLSSLVSAGKITPAVAEDLKETYAGDNLSVTLSSGADDGFDALCDTLDKNVPADLEGATGPQDLTFASDAKKGTEGEKSQIEQVADKMAADAAS